MKGQTLMYNYKWKVAGMVIAAVSFIALVIQKLTHFTVLTKLNADQHFNILLWLTVFGLFTMMFSYEKHEDERVKQIRAKSVMMVFMLMFAATMGIGFTMSIVPVSEMGNETVTPSDMIEIGRLLMYYPACAVILYHIIFNVGLYFDNEWDYEDNTSVLDNIKNHWPRMIIRAIISVIIIWAIFKFIL